MYVYGSGLMICESFSSPSKLISSPVTQGQLPKTARHDTVSTEAIILASLRAEIMASLRARIVSASIPVRVTGESTDTMASTISVDSVFREFIVGSLPVALLSLSTLCNVNEVCRCLRRLDFSHDTCKV